MPPHIIEERARAPVRSFSAREFASLGRMIETRQVVHVPDLSADQSYIERIPESVAAVELGGIRTVLWVPMLKKSKLIGFLSIYRQVVRPFTDKQIELIKNFATKQ